MNDMAYAPDQPMKNPWPKSDSAGTIEYKLNELEKQAAVIQEGIGDLASKIGPALHQDVEAPTAELAAARDPEQGRIASRLDDLLEYGQRTIRTIENLIGRVEL